MGEFDSYPVVPTYFYKSGTFLKLTNGRCVKNSHSGDSEGVF